MLRSVLSVDWLFQAPVVVCEMMKNAFGTCVIAAQWPSRDEYTLTPTQPSVSSWYVLFLCRGDTYTVFPPL